MKESIYIFITPTRQILIWKLITLQKAIYEFSIRIFKWAAYVFSFMKARCIRPAYQGSPDAWDI